MIPAEGDGHFNIWLDGAPVLSESTFIVFTLSNEQLGVARIQRTYLRTIEGRTRIGTVARRRAIIF